MVPIPLVQAATEPSVGKPFQTSCSLYLSVGQAKGKVCLSAWLVTSCTSPDNALSCIARSYFVPKGCWSHLWARIRFANRCTNLNTLVWNKAMCVSTVLSVVVCMCVFVPFIPDVKFVGCTSRGQTGFLVHLPSAVHAFIFLARRIQPFLSLVDREVEFYDAA